ncbi:DUF3078 domain-containing protein [bacterium]|nr:DUF3078 domain-containing protein [bacterium]
MWNKFLMAMLLCLGGWNMSALAQRRPVGVSREAARAIHLYQPDDDRWAAAFDSLVAVFKDWHYAGNDTLSNPYYAPLMGSPTLYGATLHRLMGLPADTATRQSDKMLPSSERMYAITEATDNALMAAYTAFPWFVLHEEAEQGTMNVENRIREGVRAESTLTERFVKEEKREEQAMVVPAPGDEGWDILVRRPNFWTFKTRVSFQFTQNHVSDNWYKGGEDHNSLLASTTIEANFNNQQKITFDNKLEMNLGFQTSENDEVHKFKTYSDLLRLTNSFGLQAFKNWYYTISLQSWTQFCRGYRANDKKVYSDFLSPFESLLSVGMKYKMQSKNKKFNIDATFSPIGLKLKYVDRDALVTSFGLNEGHNAKWERGSNITVNYTWNLMKNVSWRSRFYYFTDYSKSQIEWENTFSFTINKYLKGSLFLYPRFDDSRQRKEGETYFQFSEQLLFGLEFNF